MPKPAKRPLVAVVLAAGQGTRMNSQIPKVLHAICGVPMIDHVLNALKPLGVQKTYVVTGHLHDVVKKHIGNRGECVLQKVRLGTGHAVKMVAPHLKNFDGDVLIMVGDAPLIQTQTLEALVARRRSHHTSCVVLTTEPENPKGYGRIVRNRDSTVRKIVEEKDTNSYESSITEVNTGTYCFDAQKMLWALKRLKDNNAQKEFYLTDTVQILGESGNEVEASLCEDAGEVMGVNSRRDLAMAERCLRLRILNRAMDSGVTVVDPSTTFIDLEVKTGIDTTVHPFTLVVGKTTVGEGCDIGPNVTVRDCQIGKGVRIRNSVVENAKIGDNVTIGPYAVIKPGAVIPAGTTVGSFAEVGGK